MNILYRFCIFLAGWRIFVYFRTFIRTDINFDNDTNTWHNEAF